MLDLDDRLDELKRARPLPRMRMVSGPQGPRVVLDGRPVLLLCSGNALGLADHPRVRQAAADAAMRWGVGAGARARVVRDDDAAPPARGAARRLHRRSAPALLFGSGALANLGVIPALARRGEVVLHDELSHSSIVDGCRLVRRRRRRLPPRRRRAPRVGAAPVRRPRGADRHRRHVRHGRRRRAAGGDRRARRTATTCACWSTRRTRSARSAPAAAARSPRPASRARSTSSPARSGKALGSYGGFAACDHVTARFLVHSARTLLHSTALPPVAVAAAMAALDLLEEQPRRVEKLRANAEALRDGLAREGFEVSGARRPRRPARRRRRRARAAGSSTTRSSRASSPRPSARPPSRERRRQHPCHPRSSAARSAPRARSRSAARRCRSGWRRRSW